MYSRNIQNNNNRNNSHENTSEENMYQVMLGVASLACLFLALGMM